MLCLASHNLQEWSQQLESQGLLQLPLTSVPPAPEQQAQQERLVFDVSRLVGLAWRKNKGPITAFKLAQKLSSAGFPCISGNWQAVPGAAQVQILRRPPCQALSPGYCYRWREALDGLVMGAGDTLRYSRHSHFSDGECVDLLYDITAAEHWRWAVVPEVFRQKLEPLLAQLAHRHAHLKLLGYAEKVIFCCLEDKHPQLSGHRYHQLWASITRFARREIPEIGLQEMSPQAVWEEN